jgi:metal-responsive CopG/Arc/MetJ family transcriptional regulator
MADTEPRYSLPDVLRERLEAAAREEATSPDELIAQAVTELLRKRSWERRMDRLNAIGERSAAAIGSTDETLDEEIHSFRRKVREQSERTR